MFIIGGQTLIIAFGLLKNILPRLENLFFRVSKDVVFIFLYYIGTLQSQYKNFFFFFRYTFVYFKLYSTLSLRKYIYFSSASLKQS